MLIALVNIFRRKYIDLKKLDTNKHVGSEDLWSLIIDASKRKILVWKKTPDQPQ